MKTKLITTLMVLFLTSAIAKDNKNELEFAYSSSKSDTKSSSTTKSAVDYTYLTYNIEGMYEEVSVNEETSYNHKIDIMKTQDINSFKEKFKVYYKVTSLSDKGNGFDSVYKIGAGLTDTFLNRFSYRIGYQLRNDSYTDSTKETFNMFKLGLKAKHNYKNLSYDLKLDYDKDISSTFNQLSMTNKFTTSIDKKFSLRFSNEYIKVNELIKGMKTKTQSKNLVSLVYNF